MPHIKIPDLLNYSKTIPIDVDDKMSEKKHFVSLARMGRKCNQNANMYDDNDNCEQYKFRPNDTQFGMMAIRAQFPYFIRIYLHSAMMWSLNAPATVAVVAVIRTGRRMRYTSIGSWKLLPNIILWSSTRYIFAIFISTIHTLLR